MRLIMLACFALLLQGCSTFWETKVTFPGPRQGVSVMIAQPFPANGWGIRVVLNNKKAPKTLYEVRGDVFLDFAEVAWSPDGEQVAVFTCGTPALRMAHNIADDRSVPFVQMEAAMALRVRAAYRLDNQMSNNDIFNWACSSDGVDHFSRLHPNASPR